MVVHLHKDNSTQSSFLSYVSDVYLRGLAEEDGGYGGSPMQRRHYIIFFLITCPWCRSTSTAWWANHTNTTIHSFLTNLHVHDSDLRGLAREGGGGVHHWVWATHTKTTLHSLLTDYISRQRRWGRSTAWRATHTKTTLSCLLTNYMSMGQIYKDSLGKMGYMVAHPCKDDITQSS